MKSEKQKIEPKSKELPISTNSPTAIMAALKKAGYKLQERFSRKNAELTLFLSPPDLLAENGNFQALETCGAMGLNASCRVYAATVQPLLILTVTLADEPQNSEQGTSKVDVKSKTSEMK